MPGSRRSSVCGAAIIVLLVSSALSLRGQGLPTWIILMNAPQQLVELPDDRGRLRLWRFQANARVDDTGRAMGGAVVERGGTQYEFSFRTGSYVADEARVVLTLNGVGVKTVRNQEEEFDFVATATQSAAEGGIIIYDIQQVSGWWDKPPFQALGTITIP